MRFNGEDILPSSLQKAREHFATNLQHCIEEVERGEVTVNDPEQYFERCKASAVEILAGQRDHTFTLLQRAYFEQTGKSVAFFAN